MTCFNIKSIKGIDKFKIYLNEVVNKTKKIGKVEEEITFDFDMNVEEYKRDLLHFIHKKQSVKDVEKEKYMVIINKSCVVIDKTTIRDKDLIVKSDGKTGEQEFIRIGETFERVGRKTIDGEYKIYAVDMDDKLEKRVKMDSLNTVAVKIDRDVYQRFNGEIISFVRNGAEVTSIDCKKISFPHDNNYYEYNYLIDADLFERKYFFTGHTTNGDMIDICYTQRLINDKESNIVRLDTYISDSIKYYKIYKINDDGTYTLYYEDNIQSFVAIVDKAEDDMKILKLIKREINGNVNNDCWYSRNYLYIRDNNGVPQRHLINNN